MSQIEKLLQRIINNPKAVKFEELEKILSNYSHLLDIIVDRSFGRSLFLKYGFTENISAQRL